MLKMSRLIEVVEENLREKYPNGDPDFIPMTIDEIRLYSDKNHDYTHGGDPLSNGTRVANILAQYPGLKPSKPVVVWVIYLLKQLDAALWLLSQGHETVVEGQDERWRDVSVYAKIIRLVLGKQH
jgi:hypothetical protein